MAATQLPEAFGMSVAVEDTAAARRFSTGLYAHDRVLEGVFGGIAYLSIVRDGETLVNIFQKGEGNPLADVFPSPDGKGAYRLLEGPDEEAVRKHHGGRCGDPLRVESLLRA